ncbi:unnamed protein product [Lepidochelys olivacea]
MPSQPLSWQPSSRHEARQGQKHGTKGSQLQPAAKETEMRGQMDGYQDRQIGQWRNRQMPQAESGTIEGQIPRTDRFCMGEASHQLDLEGSHASVPYEDAQNLIFRSAEPTQLQRKSVGLPPSPTPLSLSVLSIPINLYDDTGDYYFI